MEPILFLLGASAGFLLGYLCGHRDLRHEKLLESISTLKEKIFSTFTSHQKVYILDSKDAYNEEDEE